MPNAAQYRSSAQRFRHASDRARSLLVSAKAGFGPSVMVGGSLSTEVMAALNANSSASLRVAGECDNLAQTCEQRARECEQWSQRIRDWEAAMQNYRARQAWLDACWQRHRADPKNCPAPTWVEHGPGPRPVPPPHVVVD